MGQLQEERKAKVSLILLTAFIRLWSSDALSTHIGEDEVAWHGSSVYWCSSLAQNWGCETCCFGHTDKFGLLVPIEPLGEVCIGPLIHITFPIPEVLGPTGSPWGPGSGHPHRDYASLLREYSLDTSAEPFQCRCSDHSDF